jgi:hypothetical protein
MQHSLFPSKYFQILPLHPDVSVSTVKDGVAHFQQNSTLSLKVSMFNSLVVMVMVLLMMRGRRRRRRGLNNITIQINCKIL